MKAWSVLVMLLVLLLAGCIGGEDPEDVDTGLPGDDEDPEDDPEDENDENETVPPPGLALSDLKECDFLYPDGQTPVQCEDTFDTLSVLTADPPGTISSVSDDQVPWLCVEQNIEANWAYSIYWDPDQDRYGMYYEFEEPGLPVSGVFYKDDGSVGASFYNAGDSGFFVLPDVGRSDDAQMVSSVQFVLYTHNYLTDTPELEGGEIKALWSHFNGTVYPLQVIEAGGETYYLHNVTAKPAGSDAFTYHIQAPMLEGEDFNVTVQSFELKRFQVGWDPKPALCRII